MLFIKWITRLKTVYNEWCKKLKNSQILLGLLILFWRGIVKNLTRLFALIAMVAFIGCATTGGGFSAVNASDGGSKSKLSDADYKRMGITHGGYGNSH